MLTSDDCIKTLMDKAQPLEVKWETITEFLRIHSLVARRMGVPVTIGRITAWRTLFEGLSEQDSAALRQELDKVNEYSKTKRSARNQHAQELAAQLRAMTPGTAIVVRLRNQKLVVAFVSVQRTRFLYETDDGRQFSAPVQAFLEKASKKAVKLMPTEIREQREFVRALASRHRNAAYAEIRKNPGAYVAPLLDELAAALRRIDNAPIGISRGFFGASLGPCKIVNPADSSLVHQIPAMVAELADVLGIANMRRRVRVFPDAKVRDLMNKAMEKLDKR